MSLASSDPKVATIGLVRRQTMKKKRPITPELRRLLILPENENEVAE
jgi:hypothetical protein